MDGGGGGGGTGNNNPCLMAFGENSNGFCPILMMPNLPSSNPGNSHFLPQDLPHDDGGGSPMNNTSTGYYFMESTNDGDNNCSTRAKIMGHPHYHRLLSAYANCHKVKQNLSCP